MHRKILALFILALWANLPGTIPSTFADPVKVKVYDRKSKIFERSPELASDDWTCFDLMDEVVALSEEVPLSNEWRFAGLAIDTFAAEESETSCWVTELSTSAVSALDCDDADFTVPGNLSAPFTEPDLSWTKICGRGLSGTPQVTIRGSY